MARVTHVTHVPSANLNSKAAASPLPGEATRRTGSADIAGRSAGGMECCTSIPSAHCAAAVVEVAVTADTVALAVSENQTPNVAQRSKGEDVGRKRVREAGGGAGLPSKKSEHEKPGRKEESNAGASPETGAKGESTKGAHRGKTKGAFAFARWSRLAGAGGGSSSSDDDFQPQKTMKVRKKNGTVHSTG